MIWILIACIAALTVYQVRKQEAEYRRQERFIEEYVWAALDDEDFLDEHSIYEKEVSGPL